MVFDTVTYAHIVAAFRQGLKETGYVEGENAAIEYRWAENRFRQPCWQGAAFSRARA
jgi:hypothetical protein